MILWPIINIAGHILHTPDQYPAWSLVTLRKSGRFYVICLTASCNMCWRKFYSRRKV